MSVHKKIAFDHSTVKLLKNTIATNIQMVMKKKTIPTKHENKSSSCSKNEIIENDNTNNKCDASTPDNNYYEAPSEVPSTSKINENFDNSNNADFVVKNISRLYNHSSLPRNLIQTIIDNSQELVEDIFNVVCNRLSSNQNFAGKIIVADEFSKINEKFQMLKTEHMRFKYFKNSETFLRPKSFYIGTRTTLSNISSTEALEVIIKNAEVKKICLKTKLKHFLELPNVYSNILLFIEKETATPEVLSSVYQGALWNKMKAKFGTRTVFPFSLFLIDDFEPCNSLGSRAGLYKVGAVYISLACIPPEQASSLENIFLSQLFYSNDRSTYGNENFFSTLIYELSRGVKEVCVWNKLPNFDVTQNIYVDLMHDLLEGVLRYDIALIINDLINKKIFTLENLNERIKFFQFSKCNVGNPMPQIKMTHLKNKCIVISAAEMLSLTTYFGVLIGDLVPSEEPTWKFYVKIFEMMEILLSRYFTKVKLQYLGVLIEEHHNSFLEIFNE
ncbi:unnamed protein product [Ceutorhynchus assimilis]|uniref:Uncharacterized protein n=1 Tax=Ceutorhynchus assimilis TaxID=467358 RepID=A0A9N9QKF7_9CUCU|nr:unnamed protein product [Ceutorhynchus assimilis]